MKSGLELHCHDQQMDITRASNQTLIYTGYRNKHGLYECDINVTPTVLSAYHSVLESLDSQSAQVNSTSTDGTPYPAYEVN